MIDMLAGKIGEVQALVQAAIVVMALVMVIAVWARSKSLVPTLGAVVFGAAVVWGTNNVEFLEQKIGEEFESRGTIEAVVVDV